MKKLVQALMLCVKQVVLARNIRVAFTALSVLSASTAAYAGYELQPNEQAIINNLLAEDVSVFAAGGDSFIGKGLVTVSANEAAKDYESNQVAGDQKYYRKQALLTGVIESINSGIGNEPYLSLKSSGNPFTRPQAHLRKGDIDNIAKLHKGDRITLVCEGAGSVAGTAMFRNCSFAEAVATKKAAELNADIGSFLKGNKAKFETTPQLVFYSIALARTLPANSPCFKAFNKACDKDRKAAEKKTKTMASQVADEMRSKGQTFTTKSQ